MVLPREGVYRGTRQPDGGSPATEPRSLMSKLIQCPKICSKREEIGEKFPELYTRFMMTARRELGIDSI